MTRCLLAACLALSITAFSPNSSQADDCNDDNSGSSDNALSGIGDTVHTLSGIIQDITDSVQNIQSMRGQQRYAYARPHFGRREQHRAFSVTELSGFRRTAQGAMEYRLPGQAVILAQDPSMSLTFTPNDYYVNASGYYCREYKVIATTNDGAYQQAFGTACRVGNGYWKDMDRQR